jgi:hypothetical protein
MLLGFLPVVAIVLLLVKTYEVFREDGFLWALIPFVTAAILLILLWIPKDFPVHIYSAKFWTMRHVIYDDASLMKLFTVPILGQLLVLVWLLFLALLSVAIGLLGAWSGYLLASESAWGILSATVAAVAAGAFLKLGGYSRIVSIADAVRPTK